MKRSIALVLSCLLAAVASAQQTLEQRVMRGYQDAQARSRISAPQELIKSYLEGDVEGVDEILTQEPLLANMKIQGEDGQMIPLVYDAFLTPRKPTAAQQELRARVDQARAEEKQAYDRYYAAQDKNGEFYGKFTEEGLGIALLYTFPYLISDAKADRADRRLSNRIDRRIELQEQLKDLRLEDARRDNPMLAVFYAHGAECEQCLKESFKPALLTPSEELTLAYQLPIYGASVEEIMELEDWHNWVKIAKEISVTSKTLPTLLARIITGPYLAGRPKTPPMEQLEDVLTRISSQTPATQQVIESYRTAYQRALAQEFKEQDIEAPRIEDVVFLNKKYEPKTSKQASDFIADVQMAYRKEVNTKYLPHGNETPASLTAQRDRAVAALERAKVRLSEYEQKIKENRDAQTLSQQRILSGVQVLGGRLDVLPLLLKSFPQEAFGGWKYYPWGGGVQGVNFRIPVIAGDGKVYDARPESFGKQLI